MFRNWIPQWHTDWRIFFILLCKYWRKLPLLILHRAVSNSLLCKWCRFSAFVWNSSIRSATVRQYWQSLSGALHTNRKLLSAIWKYRFHENVSRSKWNNRPKKVLLRFYSFVKRGCWCMSRFQWKFTICGYPILPLKFLI